MTSFKLSYNKSNINVSLEANNGKINHSLKFHFEIPSSIALLKDSAFSKDLPKGYQPNEYDVICGRGKGYYNQPGNRRFRSIIFDHLTEYQMLRNKIDKTLFLNKIIDEVRSQNNGNANFVKQGSSGNNWILLGDDLAREKVGHAIREALTPRTKMKSDEHKNLIRRVEKKALVNARIESKSEVLKSLDFLGYESFDTLKLISQPEISLSNIELQNELSNFGFSNNLLGKTSSLLDDDMYEPLPVNLPLDLFTRLTRPSNIRTSSVISSSVVSV